MPIRRKPARLLGMALLLAGLAGSAATAQDTASALPPLPSTPSNLASGPLGPSTGRGDSIQGGPGSVGNTGGTSGTGGANTTSSAVNAPTSVEAGAAGQSQTNLLARYLGIQDAPIKVYGWIQNSFTANANGRYKQGLNFGVYPNHLADRWQGNQYYLAFERMVPQTDVPRFGGRFDILLGNDWQYSKSYGLFDRAFKPNAFAGFDLPQIFGEVHLPILTKNGLDIRGGRFYSPAGFENVQAVKRPLLSAPYLFSYTPFTFVGVLTTLHVNERLNLYNGAVNGWDRWIDQNYRYSYLGGFSYNSRNLKTSVTSIVLTGPSQLPRFAPANSPFLPTGVITNANLQGKANPDYAGNWRTFLSTVVAHNYNPRLTEAAEVFFVHETNVPGLGPGGSVARESSWYGASHWLLYQFTDKVQGVWRSEIFRDNNGAATGSADNYYEVTLGAVYKPKPWLWFRPEARFDRAQYSHPFNDGTRSSQFLLAFDVIVQF